jgi:PBP1b-binding outer membrane lipoprotein LpoB
MKKIVSSIIVLSLTVFLFSGCGGKKTKVEMSKEMKEFVQMFKGQSTDVQAALQKFAVDSLKTNDMSMYNLENPKVISKEADCYTFESKAGATVRTYKVCWENGKISKIEDKGMK